MHYSHTFTSFRPASSVSRSLKQEIHVMDPDTLKDTAANVQSLLEQLRSSDAWQQAVNGVGRPKDGPGPIDSLVSESPTIQATFESTKGHDDESSIASSDAPSGSSTVASLLAQLQASPAISNLGKIGSQSQHTQLAGGYAVHDTLHKPVIQAPYGSVQQPNLQTTLVSKTDLRSCTFQQALPHLVKLTEDTKFVSTVRAMKQEQSDLEGRLGEERRVIQRKHEEKVHVAQTKASMIGASITEYEAKTLTESFRRELQKFDAERALPAWDGLIIKQQVCLESFGVPLMFPTTDAADRQKQQKIMQILNSVTE